MGLLKRIYHRILSERFPLLYARQLGVKIGEQTLIGKDCSFGSEPYLVTIGSNCQITNGVSIFTHGGGHVVRRDIPGFDVFGKVTIEDGAYIGSHSLIMPGVIVGRCAMVAAGSVVTKSVPERMVVAGNPARIICSVDDYYQRNKPYVVSTYRLDAEEKKSVLLSLTEEKFIKK